MIVRDQTRDDDAAVRAVLTDAFGDKGQVAGLAEALAARTDPRSTALVAVEDDAVIGHVQLSVGWIDADRRLVEIRVLSPLGVAPSQRRRGAGGALCAAAVARAKGLGVPAVVLEGDPAYYGRLGWQRASAHGLVRPSPRIPDVAMQVTLLPGHEPWMVGAVVYNDTFWRLDFVGLRPAQRQTRT